MHFLIQHTFSAILVGEALLRQNALLLPDVYDSFLNKLKQVIQVHHITTGSSEIGNTVTSNWFQSKPPSLLDPPLGLPMLCEEVWYTLVSAWRSPFACPQHHTWSNETSEAST